ncbi:MAG: MFS transporter [Pseudomonadaceae bacterium]|nr:MFS transporter [Pseudomonadaceae bacterium]
MGFINRNLLVLFTCQIVFVSGSILLVTVGGIVGHTLASDPSLATLPVALMVVGTAVSTIPAAIAMQRLGRKWGFFIATLIAASGAWVATVALEVNDFTLFCLATTVVGSSLGFSQQFRFAAAESVSPDKVSHAVSFILLGSICGAFLGPELVSLSATRNPQAPYGLGFYGLIILYLASGALLLALKPRELSTEQAPVHEQPRQIVQMLLYPALFTAVLAGVVGQGVMTYVMTATPLSMTVGIGYSLQEASEVIRAHVIAMYLPSLMTPWLITRLGLSRVMALGTITLAATLCIGLLGHHLMHYWFSMVMLGIGWNFLFVGGTTQLVQSYHPSERFRAQALNDFSVFSASAAASLLAGVVLFYFGWSVLLISTAPALFLMLVTLVWARGRQQSQTTS